ncbi:MAG: glutamate--cysteine ligase [Proteobacteria bacterium]|nr:glutamate--cysteine ligase [Pseudomonadota bacterium]
MQYPDTATLDALGRSGGCLFHGGLKGLEKESLRVAPDGSLAQTGHPRALGSTLTHPFITTDYSEALLEFITPPENSAARTLDWLHDVQRFTYANLGDELLWATSMPCRLGRDEDIPIARYGSSNVGRMKHVYRHGLGHRYGRRMQTISGVHFNYSLPEHFWTGWRALFGGSSTEAVKNSGYFCLIRNFQRLGWLIPYLFGASPAVCRSFTDAGGTLPGMEMLDPHTAYLPWATSLRMSDIGYRNKAAQAALNVSYNDLDSYIASLTHAISTPWPPYDEIGVKVGNAYRQLNNHILQIENEFYSFIRPKNIARSGEKPTSALQRAGVRYIEVRALDVSAFDPAGVNLEELHFLEVFLAFCLLSPSPPIGSAEQEEIDHNQSLAVTRGREPGLQLQHNGTKIELRAWADEVLEAMQSVAQLLDACEPGNRYASALAAQREIARHPERTPSARVLEEMRMNKESFFAFAMRKSEEHRGAYLASPLDAARDAFFREAAARSLREQRDIEAADTLSFEQYLERYFNQTLPEPA